MDINEINLRYFARNYKIQEEWYLLDLENLR